MSKRDTDLDHDSVCVFLSHPELHDSVVTGDHDRFFALYEELPGDHRDLAVRWTDLFERTLLYT